jgi:hypothetical protein
MTSNKILGVRGNNDQKVIEWGAWMDWILSRSGGWEWLAAMDKQFPDLDGDNQRKVVINWVKTSKYADWENLVPKGWHLLGNHYRVARAMSREHFNYLRSLPLVLHSPASHSFFVHAGLLPSNPKFPAFDPTQPLSHWPAAADDQRDIAKLRIMQELAVLSDIPQNNDPWIVMNIRGVAHNGNVSTSNKKGTPWSQLWNDTMAECSGMNVRGTYKPTSLPCYPFTVIYGHAASRGLDIKRWSVGLDTGCVSETKFLPSQTFNSDIMLRRTVAGCRLLSSMKAPCLLSHQETTLSREPLNRSKLISETVDEHASLV